jgi:retron-type reverse transcriptase/ribonuclease HI
VSLESNVFRPRRGRRLYESRPDCARRSLELQRYDAFVHGHGFDGLRFGHRTSEEQRELLRVLLWCIAHFETLSRAVDELVEGGEKAAGPDGRRLADRLRRDKDEVRAELRAIRDDLLEGTYQPDSPRTQHVPKKVGTRPIAIHNGRDQIVQRAIVDIVQPLLDPTFEDSSFGFRPRRGRMDALANAAAIIEIQNRPILLPLDVKDAFGRVLRADLLDRLRFLLANEAVVDLIRRIITTPPLPARAQPASGTRVRNRRNQGISQGGCLSPFLLNVLFDHVLDKPWKRNRPTAPMLRFADDLLVHCSSVEEAQDCLSDLSERLKPIGMQLKDNSPDRIINLDAAQSASWLGFLISRRNGRVSFQLSEEYYSDFESSMREKALTLEFPVVADGILRNVLEQLGPCYDSTPNKLEVIRRLRQTVLSLGADELPSETTLLSCWAQGAVRFEALRSLSRAQVLLELAATTDVGAGSASHHRPRPPLATDGQPPAGRPETVHLDPLVLLVTAARTPDGGAAWACKLKSPEQKTWETHFRHFSGRVTENRLQLVSVLEAVRAIPWDRRDRPFRIQTDSRYVLESVRDCWQDWMSRGGRSRSGEMIANWRLWSDLRRELAGREWSLQALPGSTAGARDCRDQAYGVRNRPVSFRIEPEAEILITASSPPQTLTGGENSQPTCPFD